MNSESAKSNPYPLTEDTCKRRHPAKKSRIAALACSVATTGGLANIMFQSDQVTAASGPTAKTATSTHRSTPKS